MAERVQSGPQQSRARRCSGAAQRTLDGEDRSERITGGRKGSLIPAYSPTKIPEFPKLKAPRLRQDLRDRLKANCKALNAETAKSTLEFQLTPVSGAKIRRIDRPAVLTVEFNQDSLRIKYSCGMGVGTCAKYEFPFAMSTVRKTPAHS